MSDILDQLEYILLAGKDKVTAGLPVKQGSDNLLYYSIDRPSDEIAHLAYAATTLGGADTVRVSSWSDLATDLKKRSAMVYEQIVFSTHAGPGAMKVGTVLMSLEQVLASWSKAGIKPPTAKSLVALEGCCIGDQVEGMFKFGAAFNSRQVSAWNKYHAWGVRQFPTPNDPDPPTRRTKFMKIASLYEPYLFPRSDSLQTIYAGLKPGETCTLPHEWFMDTDSDERLTDGLSTTDPLMFAKKFIPRHTREQKFINTLSEAEEFDQEATNTPAGLPLYQIFVTSTDKPHY